MTFVSYAQNFEDIMLWRALKHVENGFYVDVGAQDPIVDSVSLAFYERGWRGVHIEPSPYYAEKLRQHRPDEIVIQAAIGTAPNEVTFFEIPDTGLSTGDWAIAEGHRIRGLTVREITVPSLTLTQALEQYSGRDIHWLKIDVEGFEQQVIEGWDGENLQPWVVVIESTTPMSANVTHQDWEPLVLKKNYGFAYFDGLNRYYIRKDHRDLLASFDRPPNVFDDFVLAGPSGPFTRLLNEQLVTRDAEINRLNAHVACQQDEWAGAKAQVAQGQQQLAARDAEINRLNAHVACQQDEWASAKARLAQGQQQLAARDAEINRLNAHVACQQDEWADAKAQLAEGQQQLAARDAEIDRLSAEINRLNAHIAWQQFEWDSVRAEIAQTQQQLSAEQARIGALLSSRSWRLTKPLRAIGSTVRRITGLPALTKRRLKSALKSYVVPAATLLDAHPVFKSTLRRAFRPFPGFHARLARAARPSVVMATGGAKIESVPEVQPRDLAPTARRVYQDLLDARTERSKRQDTHAEA